MKITTYRQVVNPSVISGPSRQVTTDINAYGGKGNNYGDMASALGQVNKVLAQQRDDEDATAVLDAKNKIISSLTDQLYNSENGLLTTGVGQNAQGLTDRVNQAIQKTTDEVIKMQNPRVAYRLKNSITDNINNFQRIAMGQEREQKEATDNANWDALLSNKAILAGNTYSVQNMVTNIIRDTERDLITRGKTKGWTGAIFEANRQKMITQIVASAVQSALNDNADDRALEIANNYRKDMDQGTYGKLVNSIKKKKEVNDMYIEADNLIVRDKDGNIDLEASRKNVENKYGRNAVRYENDAPYDHLYDLALRVTKITGGNPDFIYGQMSLESDHGKSRYAIEDHNYAGLTNGPFVSDDDFVQAYADTLMQDRYKGWQNASTATEYANIMYNGGYFTSDPNQYAVNIDDIANSRKKSSGITSDMVDAGANAWLNQTMDNGKNGCAEYVTKAGSMYSPFLKQEFDKGVVYVPTLVENARSAGIQVTDFDANNLKKGDLIVYSSPSQGSDSHVVIYDGNGGYYGNSSSNNITMHGDNYNIEGLTPQRIIKTGVTGRQVSGYDMQKQLDIMSIIEGKYKEETAIKNQQRNSYLTGIEESIRSGATGDYISTKQMLDTQANSGSITWKEHDDLLKIAGSKYNINVATGQEKGTRGTGSGRAYNPTKDQHTLAVNQLRLQMGEDLTAEQIIDGNEASARLIENGYDTGGADLDNQDIMSGITTLLDNGSTPDEIKEALISSGASEETANYYISLIDNSYYE